MEAVNTVKNVFFEAIRIMSKVFEIWGFAGDRFNFNFKDDIGEDKDGQKGSIREAIDNILGVF